MATFTKRSNTFEGRYLELKITQTQNIAENKSTLNWTLTSTGGAVNYYSIFETVVKINGQQVYYKGFTNWDSYAFPASRGSVSGSITVEHNSDGSLTVPVVFKTAVYSSANHKDYGGNFVLDKNPRQANLTAAPNFNDESNPTITYSNPAGDVVDSLKACISLDGNDANIAYRDISKTGTSYTFNLTEAERNVLRNGCNNANSRNVVFIIQTVINGVTYYSKITKTLTIVNANPTLYPIIEDTNNYVVSLTGKASKLVKYFSSPLVETGSAAKKGAWITNNAISNGNKYTTKASDTFYNVDNAIFGFWAKDSRGNEIYQEINKINEGNWIDYVKITCNATPTNPTTDGKMTLNISGNYWNGNFGAVANYLTLQYRMAVVGTDFPEWVTIPAELNGNTYNAAVAIEGLDYQTTYKFEVRALDKLETTPTRYFEIQTTPVFDWGKNDFSFNVPVSNLNPLPMDLPDGNGDAEYWRNLKSGIYWYDMNMSNVGGMPSGWGFVHKIGFVGNDFNIMYYTQAEGSIFRRSGNLTSDSGWKELLYKS